MHHHYLIVTKSFEHIVECFCPDGDHSDVLEVKKEDFIEVTNDKKFLFDTGWYILVILNRHWHFYMALDDLDKYFTKGYLASLVDIELKINHLKFQIDQSLGKGDEPSFLHSTKCLKESSELKVRLEHFLHQMEIESQFL